MLPRATLVSVHPGPLLVVLAGRPGTGKTTLAALLATRLHAGHVRTDTIATALIRTGVTEEPSTAGFAAYVVAHEIAEETLKAATPVVVDAVNGTHERRGDWVRLAHRLGARLVVLETTLHDPEEHQRRVEQRRPDLAGQGVPGWGEATTQRYDDWDDARDGSRQVVDMSDTEQGLGIALSHIDHAL